MLAQITDWLMALIATTGVFGIFIATAVESFFPPIPSEIVLFSAGFYARSQESIPLLIILCVVAALGNFAGTLPFYLVSRFSAENWLPKFLRKFGAYLLISESDLKRTEKFFDKRGAVTVFFARLVPGIRSLIAFPAGLAKMHFGSYTFFTLLGSLSWNLLLGGIGYWAYGYKDQVLAVLEPISTIILAIAIIVVVLYVLRVIYQVRKIRSQSA